MDSCCLKVHQVKGYKNLAVIKQTISAFANDIVICVECERNLQQNIKVRKKYLSKKGMMATRKHREEENYIQINCKQIKMDKI